jgi:hypothetical protein
MSVGSRAIVTACSAADNGVAGIYGASNDYRGTRVSGSRAIGNVWAGFAYLTLQDSQSQVGDRNNVISAGGNVDANGLH